MAETKKNTPDAAPCRRPDVPFKEFGPAEGMLLDLESGEYFGLEGTAVAIWKQLDGRTPVDRVSASIAEGQGADIESIDKDVTSFLRQLRKAGLLAEPGVVKPQGRAASSRPGRSRKEVAMSPYLKPRLAKRGNLKFLGQLD